MSENKEEKDNVISLDSERVRKLKEKGHYNTMLEGYEMLRLKFMYGDKMTTEEGFKFITLTKYFAENGHSEPFRYTCQQILKKYVIPNGL